MSLFSRISCAVGGCVLGLASSAMAVPALQLDITGGVYDPVTETIIAGGTPFTLDALAKGDAGTFDFTRTYYISAAIVPDPGAGGASLGSFKFGATTYNVTTDMLYGVPPVEANIAFDAHDLSKHGIFPTWFIEVPFNFTAAQTNAQYNTADDAGDGPLAHPGTGSFYQQFVIDTSNLDESVSLHFDLYNEVVHNGGDVDRDDFAPFSHDAQSLPGGSGNPPPPPPPPGVPEPLTASMGLIALSGLGLRLTRRR